MPSLHNDPQPTGATWRILFHRVYRDFKGNFVEQSMSRGPYHSKGSARGQRTREQKYWGTRNDVVNWVKVQKIEGVWEDDE